MSGIDRDWLAVDIVGIVEDMAVRRQTNGESPLDVLDYLHDVMTRAIGNAMSTIMGNEGEQL